ncbi:gliding motility-associated C-terminal domain-containing protein [Flavobacterium sp. HJJ]|uniref:gliding motility-associated C-terminal domain-containing protein n=1 Tax=Flavobacterium sp. HJJ TaxID=2783792 RepID=UPI00188DC635|nr:gliding motility-associated C-terminal domain-containing protein [Flavobacterium sp. HJJ]MBF4470987.1 gliding motility-associated C-terminal domain-containing protein [Flavobacterium sp. HJJ]
MVRKLLFSSKFTLPTCLIVFLFLVFSTDINAQCAGNNNSLTLCGSDITNVSSKSIDLNLLLGTHTAGGTWSDDDNSGGLVDTATGILNAQKVYESGIYHYTYTINGVVGCVTNTATITVTIGGYAGVPGPNNSICSSDHAYSLFQVFQGTPVLAPQSGGTWQALTFAGGLNTVTGVLNASVPPPYNTYSYKYSINAIGSCPAVSSQVSVSIYRTPEPGTPSNLQLCSNQLGSYTNVNLYNQLSGEDTGGTWTEFGTSELSNSTDSTIDIQNIYNTKGPGYYSFTYTVSPPKDDRVCSKQSATVTIAIGEQLDFTSATLTVNPNPVCENNLSTTIYTGILTQGAKPIANGYYRVDYSISGVGSFVSFQNFSNGILIFPIPTSYFSQVRNYTVSVTNVTLTASPVFCSSIVGTIQDVVNVYPSPKINSATLTIPPVCQGADALAAFSGTSNLTDGSYDIIYNLSGSNNLNGIPATMNVIGGLSTFTIQSAYIPKAGTTAITITRITNSATGCPNASNLRKDFTVNPSLDLSNLGVTVKDACAAQPTEVTLTGLGILTAIDVTYNLTGSNTTGSKIISLTAVAGQVKFSIPAADIPNTGSTSLNITNVTNTITGCTFAINKGTSFTVNPLPNTPAASGGPFCSADNATVANLTPQGNQYQWFDSAASTTPLALTTPLRTGDYFVKEVNPVTLCESALKKIQVTINTTPQIDSARLSIATTCQSYTVTVLLGGSSNLANGDYNVLYSLSGANTGTRIAAVLSVTSGIGRFDILPNFVPNVGTTTVQVTNITNPNTGCTNTANLSKSFITNPLPDISSMVTAIKDICQGQSTNVELSGLGSLTTININYRLLGANIVSLKTISLTVVNGKVSFIIPASDIPKAGLTTFNLTNITNTVTGCPIFTDQKTNFTVSGPPDTSSMTVTVKDGCPNQPLNVIVSGLGTLSSVKFSYSVTGANTINAQTDALIVTGGSTNFTILGSGLPNTGSNSLIMNDIINLITTCSAVIPPAPKSFAILPIPSKPAANDQGFCKENSATVANLKPSGTQYKWYNSANSTTPLQPSTLLISGNYYLTEVNLTTGCESNATVVNVAINSVPVPTLKTDGQNFCGADKPTIQNLTSNTSYTGNLTWYDAPVNGTAYDNTVLLTEGTTYYAIDYNPNTKCVSGPLETAIILTACSVTPDGLTIPDGFSPNGDGINDTFKILDIEYLFPNFSIEIFNRYGNIMFKGNINKPDWDGKNSNSSFISGDAATGVYFYIINYNKENFSPRQGQLYLNR